MSTRWKRELAKQAAAEQTASAEAERKTQEQIARGRSSKPLRPHGAKALRAIRR